MGVVCALSSLLTPQCPSYSRWTGNVWGFIQTCRALSGFLFCCFCFFGGGECGCVVLVYRANMVFCLEKCVMSPSVEVLEKCRKVDLLVAEFYNLIVTLS